jgi:hypothetical protein
MRSGVVDVWATIGLLVSGRADAWPTSASPSVSTITPSKRMCLRFMSFLPLIRDGTSPAQYLRDVEAVITRTPIAHVV